MRATLLPKCKSVLLTCGLVWATNIGGGTTVAGTQCGETSWKSERKLIKTPFMKKIHFLTNYQQFSFEKFLLIYGCLYFVFVVKIQLLLKVQSHQFKILYMLWKSLLFVLSNNSSLRYGGTLMAIQFIAIFIPVILFSLQCLSTVYPLCFFCLFCFSFLSVASVSSVTYSSVSSVFTVITSKAYLRPQDATFVKISCAMPLCQCHQR